MWLGLPSADASNCIVYASPKARAPIVPTAISKYLQIISIKAQSLLPHIWIVQKEMYELAQEEGTIQFQTLCRKHELILFSAVTAEYHSCHVHLLLFTIDFAGACACARSPLGDVFDRACGACGIAASQPRKRRKHRLCYSGKKVCHFAPNNIYLYFSGHFDTVLMTGITVLDGYHLSKP